MRTILMSVRSVFAEAAFRKAKRYEYRRCWVSAERNDIVIVYETAPTKMITGTFVVGEVIHAPLDQLAALEPDAEIRLLVADYLEGARRCCALEITQPLRWSTPQSLDVLWPNMRAPQSYQFLNGVPDELLRHSS